MNSRRAKIAALTAPWRGRELDARYLTYFDLFNQQRFFEAHEVLEGLWLADRSGYNAAFYKGLIQLAGAFVHLQRNGLGPGAALFRLARANLAQYPPRHEHLDVAALVDLTEDWLARLAMAQPGNLLKETGAPQISLPDTADEGGAA